MHSCPAAHCARQQSARGFSTLPLRADSVLGFAFKKQARQCIRPNRVQHGFSFMDWSFASGCSPPRLSTTQLPSATDRPVLLSDGDFHPTVGAYFQAHSRNRFAVENSHTARHVSHLSPLAVQRSRRYRRFKTVSDSSQSPSLTHFGDNRSTLDVLNQETHRGSGRAH
jgi:hypothetical protein